MLCTASVLLTDGLDLPDEETDCANEGTRLHEEAAKAARGQGQSVAWDAVKHLFDGLDTHIEEPVELFYSAGEHGTPDLWAYDPQNQQIIVVDYKFGAGIRVKAEGNPQLLIYAVSLSTKLDRFVKGYKMYVYQPAFSTELDAWHVRDIVVEGVLRFEDEVKRLLGRIDKGQVEFHPSEDTCRFCPLKATCPARRKNLTGQAGVELADPSELMRVDQISLPWLKQIELHGAKLKSLIDAARKRFHAMVAAGEVPGWQAGEGPGRRTWADQDAVLERMTALTMQGIPTESLVKYSAVSPAQLEKKIGKELFEEEFGDLVEITGKGTRVFPGVTFDAITDDNNQES